MTAGAPSRRGFGAMLAAALAAGVGESGCNADDSRRFVLSSYGGDTKKYLEAYAIEPLLKPKGIRTAFESSFDGPRKLKLLAERRLAHGTYDVVHDQASVLYEMSKRHLLAELDLARLGFYRDIIPALRTTYAVPMTCTPRVILYNPAKVARRPRSYADLWNPAFGNKIGVIDPQYAAVIAMAALVGGGSLSDYEPGKAKLLELKRAGVRIYPEWSNLGQALQTGECWVGVGTLSRGLMWRNAGVPIEIAYPEEGSVLDWWGFGIPKNARNPGAAYEFLNAALSDGAQAGYSSHMWSAPPTTSGLAAIAEPIRRQLQLPSSAKILPLDEDYLYRNDASLKTWWDRAFKA
ncbi:extracellular solute-binding protein [Phenylobacterium sp.]|uniref:extracellular solute-binding protein n=1 Tax=Phenylobacterium sp. TaxID=1871053 RepID=UPI0025E505CF|nr:extracellular solute-binding protein [Phenylobacterium sp.]